MLNTIKDLKEVNGKEVRHVPVGACMESSEKPSIIVGHGDDSITFKMLTKPASEGGDLNLCQLTDVISVAKSMLEYLHNKFPCRENAITITKLDEALMWQEQRTKNRISRGVEGKNLN